MKRIYYPNKAARNTAFYDYEARGIRADAYVKENGDIRYEEYATERYLVRKALYSLDVFEEEAMEVK